MFLYQHKKNKNYYVIYEKDNGKRTSVSTKTKSKGLAYKFLSNFEKEHTEKLSQLFKPISLKDFRFQFLKYSESIHLWKTTKVYVTTFNFLLEHFGNIQLSELTTPGLEDFLLKRLRESSVFAARRDLSNLSFAFNKAVRDGYLLKNPIKGIKRFKLPEKQPTFYSKEDFAKLLYAIDSEDIKDLVIFAVNTGLRQMELLTLKWSQFDSKQKIIILDNQNHLTKTKRVRTIPLNDSALNILNKRKEITGEYIFTYQRNQIKQDFIVPKFKTYVIKAGVNSKLNFHSLRHTFASWLVQKGCPIMQVSRLLGHSDLKTTMIYTHLRNEDLRNSVELLTD